MKDKQVYTQVTMNDTQQMFKAIINGQHALKDSLERKIDKLDEKLTNRMDKLDKRLSNKIDGLDKKLDTVEKNLTKRIDRLGKQLAYLEDDTPTREEFNGLEQRVHTLEEKSPATL